MTVNRTVCDKKIPLFYRGIFLCLIAKVTAPLGDQLIAARFGHQNGRV